MLVVFKDAKELAAALTVVGNMVPAKPSHRALGHFLVKVCDKGLLQVIATDMTSTVIFEKKLERFRPGQICIPNLMENKKTKLVNMVSNLVGEVEIKSDDWEEASPSVTIKCGNYELTLVDCLNTDDYPEVVQPEGQTIPLDKEKFLQALNRTMFAASKDLADFMGVNLRLVGSRLFAVATDKLRVARSSVDIGDVDHKGMNATIPTKAIALVTKVFKAVKDKDVYVMSGEGKFADFAATFPLVQVTCGSYTLITQLIQAEFPDLNPHFGKRKHRIIMKREDLENALTQAGFIAAQRDVPIVSFTLKGGELVVSATSTISGTAKVPIGVQTKCKETLTFHVNYVLLESWVKNNKNSEVALNLDDPSAPAIWENLEASEQYLLAPAQVLEESDEDGEETELSDEDFEDEDEDDADDEDEESDSDEDEDDEDDDSEPETDADEEVEEQAQLELVAE